VSVNSIVNHIRARITNGYLNPIGSNAPSPLTTVVLAASFPEVNMPPPVQPPPELC